MKRKVYLELGITLIVGILIGFFANSIITDKRIQSYSLYKGESDFWRRALTEVKVTPEQRQAIRPIIKNHSQQARSILVESWKEMQPVWSEMESKILKELTPEQQEQIKLIQSERKKRRKKHLEEPPHRRMKQGKGERRGDGKGPRHPKMQHQEHQDNQ